MKLTDLNPKWLNAGGAGITDTKTGEPSPLREGIGVEFDCPCGCGVPCFVPFTNPLDGSPPLHGVTWERTGDTFETLTLKPSILRHPIQYESGKTYGCSWHGWVTNGEVTTC